MTREDFDGRPLIAGSLIGLRVFRVVLSDGSLRGGVFPAPFEPGENVARCADREQAAIDDWAATPFELMQLRMTVLYQRVYTMAALDAPSLYWLGIRINTAPQHVLAGAGCKCGFYAYVDGTNEYADDGHFPLGFPKVEALIEGYGTCTVGSRGFRASKARLVALIDPPAPVVERYSGVPVYGTRAAALAAHPLTTVAAS